ncbi:hypothetical protein ACWEO1_17050 [Kitasatospora cineracea]
MIVWINGPFGSGKTTLVTTLRHELPGAVAADLEEIDTTGLTARQVADRALELLRPRPVGRGSEAGRR